MEGQIGDFLAAQANSQATALQPLPDAPTDAKTPTLAAVMQQNWRWRCLRG